MSQRVISMTSNQAATCCFVYRIVGRQLKEDEIKTVLREFAGMKTDFNELHAATGCIVGIMIPADTNVELVPDSDQSSSVS